MIAERHNSKSKQSIDAELKSGLAKRSSKFSINSSSTKPTIAHINPHSYFKAGKGSGDMGPSTQNSRSSLNIGSMHQSLGNRLPYQTTHNLNKISVKSQLDYND